MNPSQRMKKGWDEWVARLWIFATVDCSCRMKDTFYLFFNTSRKIQKFIRIAVSHSTFHANYRHYHYVNREEGKENRRKVKNSTAKHIKKALQDDNKKWWWRTIHNFLDKRSKKKSNHKNTSGDFWILITPSPSPSPSNTRSLLSYSPMDRQKQIIKSYFFNYLLSLFSSKFYVKKQWKNNFTAS